MSAKASMIIVEDHTLVRENLKLGFDLMDGFEVIGDFANGKDAVDFMNDCDEESAPKLVLMDVCMPEMDGFEATYRMKQKFPDVKIVLLTSLNDEKAIRIGFKVRANGYCTKDTGIKELKGVLGKVLQGERWLDPRVADFVLKSPQYKQQLSPKSVEKREGISAPPMPKQAKRQVDVENTLNARELEILELIARNYNNGQIAEKLAISEAWISGYIENIVNKLAVSNEIEAVELGLETGYLKEAPLLQGEQLY